MANKILTPITVWNDFDDTLPLNSVVSTEKCEDGILCTTVRFLGRKVGEERVSIFAYCAMPENKEHLPAVLLLPDCGNAIDESFVQMFAANGYIALMPDLRGAFEPGVACTKYPEQIAYANYSQAGRHLDYADETAKETSWYEWVGVARYCLRYLQSLPQTTQIGVVGLKGGGEIVWQLSASVDSLACAVSICAGGWRASRGMHKFGDVKEMNMTDERYRFLAGVDSQAYAPYVRCPVLMLCATNDEQFDADRAFDTYARINPQVDKSFNFAVRYGGFIGKSGAEDMRAFLGKYLKGMEMFIPAPLEICIDEDDGDLVAKVRLDKDGEVRYYNAYMAEDNVDCDTRDWSVCPLKRIDEENNEILFYLNAYKKASRVYVFAKARYSCDFSVSSKITSRKIDKVYNNFLERSRVLYCNTEERGNFTMDDPSRGLFAGSFLTAEDYSPVRLHPGPFGIRGITCDYGLRLYKINDPRFRPAENALIKFDLYCPEEAEVEVSVCVVQGGEHRRYTHTVHTRGGECWTDHVLSAKEFKNSINKPLERFADAAYISFSSGQKYYINNLIWL